MSLGRISSMLAPLVGGALLDVAWNNALLPFVSAGVLVVAAVIAFAMPLETPPEAAKLGRGREVARSMTELELGKTKTGSSEMVAKTGSTSGMVDVSLGSEMALIGGNSER